MKNLRHYQSLAANMMAVRNIYLTDACGLGKTVTSIEAVKEAGCAYGSNLVICRKAARLQWKEEIEDQVPGAHVIIVNHLPYKFRTLKAWFIAHYDEVTPQSQLYNIAATVWDTIIVDEAHRIKNHTISRTKNIIKLQAAHKYALSATPIEKHGGELWPILKWLYPEKFPAYWTWVNRTFEVNDGFFGGKVIGEPLDRKAYFDEIRPYIIHRTKDQVAPDLPPRIDMEIPIDMGQDLQTAYDEIKAQRDVLVQIEDIEMLITNALTLMTKLHQLSVLPEMLGFSFTSPKMEWLSEFLEDNPDQRVLVFSRYRAVVEAVDYHLGTKYTVFKVMSGINESDEFKRGRGRILAGTISAMSESLSLEMADAAIFLDCEWSSTQMQQAVDRIHRMNITNTKFIYYLISGSVDKRVMRLLKNKQSTQQMLLDFVKGV